MRDTILCSAFPGTGKTYYKENSNLDIIDNDSSNFDKADFPRNYVDHIKSILGTVDVVFVSSHKVVTDLLEKEQMHYLMIYPDVSLKDEYLFRYEERGDKESFVEVLDDNWDKWIGILDDKNYPFKIKLMEGQYITDVLKSS